MRRRRRLLWLIPLTLAGVAGALSFRPGVYLPAHRHCITMAGLSLDAYADLHGGRFPEHPNGYGNALMLVETGESASELTGPGYDPKALDAGLGR